MTYIDWWTIVLLCIIGAIIVLGIFAYLFITTPKQPEEEIKPIEPHYKP